MNGLNLKLVLEAVDKITAPIRSIAGKITAMLKTATAATAKFAEAMDKIGKKTSEIGGFLTSRLTAPILGFAGVSIKAAANAEDLTIQLEHLAGGAKQASEFVKSLQKYVDQFGMEDFTAAVTALETAGYSMEEIRERLAMLGPAAAGSRNSLAALTEQYIDLRKAAKLSDGDISAMQKARIPIVAELAKQLGKSEKQIWNMAANGKITFDQYRKALAGLSSEGGRFANAMERQGGSINGFLKAIKNSLSSVMAEFGSEIWTDLKIADKIQMLADGFRSLLKGFMALPTGIKSMITWGVLLLAALGPIVLIVGQFTVGIAGMLLVFSKVPMIFASVATMATGVFTAFKWLAVGSIQLIKFLPTLAMAIRTVTIAMITNPIGLFIAAIVALGVAAYMLIKHWDKVKAFFKGLWIALKEAFKSGVDGVMEYLQPLIDAVNAVVNGIGKIGNAVGRGASRAWDYAAGSDSTPAAAPYSRQGRGQVDAGGTVKIVIDQQGKARVADTKSNDSRIQYQAGGDTGALMMAR